MSGWFSSGHVVDLILLIIAVEAAWLLYRRWSPVRIVLVLGPGACLLLALRAALTGADWIWIALALAASFPLHLADLRRRSQGR